MVRELLPRDRLTETGKLLITGGPYTHTLYPYTHTLIHSYTHTLIHSYTHTLIHSYTIPIYTMLLVTGHSQGGAFANLVSMWLEKEDGFQYETITFGATGGQVPYTILVLYSHCTHTVLTLYPHCTHTLYPHCTHTLYSHCTHTLYSHCTHTVPTLYSHTVLTLYSHCTHTLYSHCTHTVFQPGAVDGIGRGHA
jgi:hypothetical protein